MKSFLLASLLALVYLCGLSNADLVSESFEYGGAQTSLGSSQNGGSGFGGAWQWGSGGTGGLFYSPSGLSFGSVASAGGSIYPTFSLSSVRSFATPFSPNGNSIGFGSFLFNVTSFGQFGQTTFALDLMNSQGGQPRFLKFENVVGQNSLRSSIISMDTFDTQAFKDNFTNGLALNTTYMQLFAFDLTSNANAAQSWIVSASQYALLAKDGITAAELNTRSIGQGDNNVLQKLSLTGDFTDQFDGLRISASLDNTINLNGYMSFDELRFSNQSFNQALGISAVPEPSSMLLMSAVAAGVGFLKRRKLRKLEHSRP